MICRRVAAAALAFALSAGPALAGIGDRLAECLAAIASIEPNDVIAGLRSGDLIGAQMVGGSRVDVVFSRYDAASGNVYVRIGDREVAMVDIDFWDDYADGARGAFGPRFSASPPPPRPAVPIPSSVAARDLPDPVRSAVSEVGGRLDDDDVYRRALARTQALNDIKFTPRQVVQSQPVPFFADAYEGIARPEIRRAGEIMHGALQNRGAFGDFVTDVVAETAERLCRRTPADCGRLAGAPGWQAELRATLEERARALGWNGIGRIPAGCCSPQEFAAKGIRDSRGLFFDEAFEGEFHGTMTHLFQVIYAGGELRKAGVGITAAEFFDGIGELDYVHGGLAWANLFDQPKTPSLGNPILTHAMLVNAGAL